MTKRLEDPTEIEFKALLMRNLIRRLRIVTKTNEVIEADAWWCYQTPAFDKDMSDVTRLRFVHLSFELHASDIHIIEVLDS